MRKSAVCAVIAILGMLFVIASPMAGSDADDSTLGEQSILSEYSISIDGSIEKGDDDKSTSTPKPTDRIPFVVKDKQDVTVSKYTLRCILDDDTSSFAVVMNSLVFFEGYPNSVVIIPDELVHSAHTDNGASCGHADKSYTCSKVNSLTLEKDNAHVETLIVKGSPELGTANGGTPQSLITEGSLKNLIIEGNPTYSLSSSSSSVSLIDGSVPIEKVFFLSQVEVFPIIWSSNNKFPSLDVYLTSSEKTEIPADLLKPYRKATQESCSTVNLYFSENSVTPAKFDGTKISKATKTNFVIDVKSQYWADYLKTSKVANEVDLNGEGLSLIDVTGYPVHTIEYTQFDGGSISSVTEAASGQIVTIDVIPDDGYMLKELKYTNGNTSETIRDEGGYSFVMPDCDIKLVAVFEKCIPDIESKHTVSGSQISIDMKLTGTRSDGKVPSSISVYVRYAGDDADTFSKGTFVIPLYSNGYSVSYETSITTMNPASYLIQVFAADGTCLNQKEVLVSG